jgi:hypothetical protein
MVTVVVMVINVALHLRIVGMNLVRELVMRENV